jgi:RNA polymerase sigma-70 factor, ECF subfamily
MTPANGLPREEATIWAGRRLPAWPESEAEFISELQSGSEAAFDWLVRHYHAQVYGLVLGILGDRTDAADVTKKVFLKAFSGIGRFQQISSLKTWLYRISVRQALKQRRWFCRCYRRRSSMEASVGDKSLPERLESTDSFPFDELAKREAQQAVQEALRRVPWVYRSALILRDLEGLSYEEVAEVLEVSVGTAKSRILRGRRTLGEAPERILAAAFLAVLIAPPSLTQRRTIQLG